MDPLMEDTNTEAPSLNTLGQITAKLLQYGNNATNNLQDTFQNMTLQGWLRLTAVVGGYLLLRPYLMHWSIKGAVKKLEEQDELEKEAAAAMTPNELRGAKEQLMGHIDEDEEGDGTGADWGQKARVRQRNMLKSMLEAEEQRRREEEEDDRDIAEYLED